MYFKLQFVGLKKELSAIVPSEKCLLRSLTYTTVIPRAYKITKIPMIAEIKQVEVLILHLTARTDSLPPDWERIFLAASHL